VRAQAGLGPLGWPAHGKVERGSSCVSRLLPGSPRCKGSAFRQGWTPWGPAHNKVGRATFLAAGGRTSRWGWTLGVIQHIIKLTACNIRRRWSRIEAGLDSLAQAADWKEAEKSGRVTPAPVRPGMHALERRGAGASGVAAGAPLANRSGREQVQLGLVSIEVAGGRRQGSRRQEARGDDRRPEVAGGGWRAAPAPAPGLWAWPLARQSACTNAPTHHVPSCWPPFNVQGVDAAHDAATNTHTVFIQCAPRALLLAPISCAGRGFSARRRHQLHCPVPG